MQIWLELISRELLFFALLFALGSGPAAFLPSRFGETVRFALAPALGLCVGVCLTVTLVYEFPARQTGWVVVGCAALSLAVAVWRLRKFKRPRPRNLVEVAIVVVVVLASFSYPLGAHHTVGPAGGYEVGDASGYMSETNGEVRSSIRQINREAPPFADLSLGYWAQYAHGDQQLDASALEADVNGLLGLGSTDTYTPFLIAILLAGALGAFATVRAAAGSTTWPAVLAGCLFAGPVFTDLFMDGSQGALTGSTLLAPLLLVGWEAVQRPRAATLVLLALLAAGLQTVYPLFVPCVVIGGAITLLVVLAGRLRRGAPSRRELLIAGGQVLSVIALAALFTPEAFSRNLKYWSSVLNGSQSLVGLPGYNLRVDVLPGWVLQTRELYGLVGLGQASPGRLVLGALVPALLIGLIAVTVLRYRLVRVMLAAAAGASVLAYYTAASDACSYCVQRNLISVSALAVPAVTLGIVAVATLGWRFAPWLAVLIALVVTVAVGHESLVVHQRLADSYLLDPQVRQTIAALPARSGPVELEGFDEGPRSPIEEPDVYDELDEKTNSDVSQPTTADDGQALFYLGGPAPLGPAFKSNYQYVLTRLASIATERQTVARRGPIALERRTHDLDVTITSGVAVATAQRDPTGTAWVAGPMQFLIVGGQPGRPAWVSLGFDRTVPVQVASNPALAGVRRNGAQLEVCLRAAGAPPVRAANLQLVFTPQPATPPLAPFVSAIPARGVRLVRMTVSTTSCQTRPPGR